MPETEKRSIEEDLDSLKAATDTLEADGVDANPEPLRDAAEVLDGPVETADEMLEAGELDDDEAREFLADGRAALLTIADGEGDTEDVEVAVDVVRAVHGNILILLLKAMSAQ